jgi:hypothetical protein
MRIYNMKILKGTLLAGLFIFLSINLAVCQNNRMDRINSEKIAFFTTRLDLKPEEARVFWPVYNDYSSRKDNIVQEKTTTIRFVYQNFKNMSDKELEEAGDKIVEFTMQEAQLTIDYHKKFKEILPPSKVVRIYNTEIQFKRHLLNQLQRRQLDRAAKKRQRNQGFNNS